MWRFVVADAEPDSGSREADQGVSALVIPLRPAARAGATCAIKIIIIPRPAGVHARSFTYDTLAETRRTHFNAYSRACEWGNGCVAAAAAVAVAAVAFV